MNSTKTHQLFNRFALKPLAVMTTLALTACGGSSGSDSGTNAGLSAFNLTGITAANTQETDGSGAVRQINLSWESAGSSASSYTICQKDESLENNCLEIGTSSTTNANVVLDNLVDAISASYFVIASDGSNTVSSSEMSLENDQITDLIGYFKASNTFSGAYFGYNIALSGDGKVLAVGAYSEDSAATGIDGEDDYQEDTNYNEDSGAVYVFRQENGIWQQSSYIKAPNSDEDDGFGYSLSLSDDGSKLAVGAWFEDSIATGINGDTTNNDGNNTGAVYVYEFSGSSWAQSAYLKASNTLASASNAFFGSGLSMSGDGSTLAVASRGERSGGTGVDASQDQSTSTVNNSGAVYVFSDDGSGWAQTGYIKALVTDSNDYFGWSLDLDEDGNTLVVGANSEDSSATGINSDASLDDASASGAAYIFSKSGSTWSQDAYLKASNTERSDKFGTAVSVSGDGLTVLVGATGEDSATTGINGTQTEDKDTDDNYASASGAVYVFTFDSTNWTQSAYIKAFNTQTSDAFGTALALNSDGTAFLVSSLSEDSAATGFNGQSIETQADEDTGVAEDNYASGAGAVFLFNLESDNWVQSHYIKATNTEASDRFGQSLAISQDGKNFAVGAHYEESASTGINGEQNETPEDSDAGTAAVNFSDRSGAVYVY